MEKFGKYMDNFTIFSKNKIEITISIQSFKVFVNNTNLTFLSFLYKINIKMSYKNKVASSGT